MNVHKQDWNGEEKAIYPVQEPAMSRQDVSRILYVMIPFYHGFNQIPNLSGSGQGYNQSKYPQTDPLGAQYIQKTKGSGNAA